MDDLISRQAAIDAIGKKSDEIYKTKQKGATYPHDDFFQGMAYAGNVVEQMPSAQPEVKEIGYAECANAMLKMWIDNVLTDGEYNRIMDKLNQKSYGAACNNSN